MNALAQHPFLGFEAYLAAEQAAQVRHEYAAGQVYAMAGGTAAHNRISLNAAATLLRAAQGGSCTPFMADMLLRIEQVAYYPDVFVVCDEGDAHRLYRTRPCLVMEVLSDSTQVIDRGEKLYNYRRIPSVDTVLLVEQGRRRVDVYRRSGQDAFVLTTLDDHGQIALDCPPCVLTLDALYDGVRFEDPPAAG